MRIAHAAVVAIVLAGFTGVVIVIDAIHTVPWDNELPREVRIRILDTHAGSPVQGIRVAIIPRNLEEIVERHPDEATRWETTCSDGTVFLAPSINAVGVEGPIRGVRATLKLDHTIYVRESDGLLRQVDAATCVSSDGWDVHAKPLELEVALDRTANRPKP